MSNDTHIHTHHSRSTHTHTHTHTHTPLRRLSYPVIMVIVGASALAAFKLGYDAIVKPETHFAKSTRGTVDYVENDYFPDRTALNQKHMEAYKASQKN